MLYISSRHQSSSGINVNDYVCLDQQCDIIIIAINIIFFLSLKIFILFKCDIGFLIYNTHIVIFSTSSRTSSLVCSPGGPARTKHARTRIFVTLLLHQLCEMHVKGIHTNLLSFLLIVQFIEDMKVPILGWSYMCAKRVFKGVGVKRHALTRNEHHIMLTLVVSSNSYLWFFLLVACPYDF